MALLAIVVATLHEPVHAVLDRVLAWAAGRGVWTGVILGALWLPVAVLLLPGSILSLGTGFLLGLGWGTVVVSLGATAGATAAFAVARLLLRRTVRARLAGRPGFQAVDEGVTREGFVVVLLLRLSPLFPYNIQNYALGATGVPFRTYLLATWIGMLPGTILYVWLGAGARTLADAARGNVGHGSWGMAAFLLGLAAAGVVTWVITRAAKRALSRRIARADG